MEKENLVKKENEIINTNNNPNKKNGIMAIVVVIAIVLIGVAVYFAFIKKNDKSVDNNGNSQQQNNNQGSDTTASGEVPVNTNVISKKMVFNSCNSIVETFNDIKVEIKNAKVIGEKCEGEIFINDEQILDFAGQGIDSVEIYDKYVIVSGGTSANGELVFYDAKTDNKAIKAYLGEYFQSQGYLSDDDGLIVIASSHAGEYGAAEPKHPYRKMRIKYIDGSFIAPEILEEYDEYKELVK